MEYTCLIWARVEETALSSLNRVEKNLRVLVDEKKIPTQVFLTGEM